MKIKFIKKYVAFHDFEGAFGTSTTYEVGTIKNVSTKPAQWLINNGFAEKVEEGVEWLHDGASYYQPAVSGLARKFVPSYNEYWGDVYDEARRRIGICYKTEEACQRFIDFLTAVEVVSHDEGFMKTDFQGSGYYMRLQYVDSDEVVFDRVAYVRTIRYAGEFFFDTEEHAKASLDKHRDEWKIIANYDWSRE